MTIEEIQNDTALRKSLFPVTGRGIYLAHAGVCPLPAPVVDRIREYADQCLYADQEEVVNPDLLNEIRQWCAQLTDVDASEIALVGPTSTALSMIASGIDFSPGQNVLVYLDDYPSNVYPWMALREKGVEVRFIKTSQLGVITPEDVARSIDSQTRLVALASCHFIAGYRIDIDAIGSMLREKGILFSLDMIQTLGAFPTSLKYVDFAAADSHKWLLGPCAAGVLYVRNDLQESFTPPVQGWHNIRCPDFISQPELVYRRDARKYEAGSPNFLGLIALHQCFRMVHDLGIENIAADLSAKRSFLVRQLEDRDMSVLCGDVPAASAGGMTSFFHRDLDLPKIHRRLAEQNITVSLRRDRTMQQYIRLSPHYYNSMNDLEHFLQSMDRIIQ